MFSVYGEQQMNETGFRMTNDFDSSSTPMSLYRVEVLIRLGYDFTEWHEELEYAE